MNPLASSKKTEDNPEDLSSESVLHAKAKMVTFRALATATLLIPLNAWWIIKMEVVRYSGHPTTISLFFNVVFLLAALLVVNFLIQRLRSKWAFTPQELITIYIMLALSSAICGHDMIEVLTPILTHVHHFARPENGWLTDIIPYLPSWLTVSDLEARTAFYVGTSSLYTPNNLRAWATPVLAWTGFFTLLGFVTLCLNTLLRRQWTESERLSYPLVMLPLEMVNPKTSLFKNRLFWIGIALTSIFEIWNGLAYLYPQLPSLPLKYAGASQNLQTYVTQQPWASMGWTPVAIYPFGVALGMLLPVDLLFSSWFFAWIWRSERIFGAAMGYNDVPGFPYVEEQSFGAYVGLAVFAIWISRRHFMRIWAGLFDRSKDLNDSAEPLPYRWACAGLLAGCGGIFLFCLACKMSPWVIAVFFLIYFTIAIAITRMRAELGPPAHDLHHAGPDSIMTSVTASNRYDRHDLALFALFGGFNRAYRSHPMPIQLEGFKMAERLQGGYRSLFWAMLFAIAFGCIAAFWADLHQTYEVGAAQRIAPPNVQLIFGREPWQRMDSWVKAPFSPTRQENVRIAIGVGFFLTLIFNTIRMRFSWFPFHPVGYAVSSSWSVNLLWLSLLVSWIIKALLLRYGGLRVYRRSLPFFFGIILGECVIGSLWMLIGIVLNIPTYAFWP